MSLLPYQTNAVENLKAEGYIKDTAPEGTGKGVRTMNISLNEMKHAQDYKRGRMSAQHFNRFIGAMLGMACGDALGAPVEFTPPHEVVKRFGKVTDMMSGGPWKAGEITDDTEMALCIASGILFDRADPVPVVGRAFINWAKTSKDVGSTCGASIRAFASGDYESWEDAAKNIPAARAGRSAGNGALMRTLPVALAYADRKEMEVQAARLAAMTHYDSTAVVGCIIYCHWIQNILEGMGMHDGLMDAVERGVDYVCKYCHGPEDIVYGSQASKELYDRLRNVGNLKYEELQPTGYAGYTIDAFEAAAWCALQTHSLEDALIAAVNLGGEADTIAAICGGVVGAYYGTEGIPRRWTKALLKVAEIAVCAESLLDARYEDIADHAGL